MINFELFLIIGACIVPFVALLFVLPKLKLKVKKKEKAKAIETQKEEKPAEIKPVVEEKPKKVEKARPLTSQEIDDYEFRNYLKNRSLNTTKPVRNQLPANFVDNTMPYLPRKRKQQPKPQSLSEEIKNLSPELKAIIITGALHKKY